MQPAPLDYASTSVSNPASQSTRSRIALAVSFLLIPVVLTLAVRSLVWDYRGNRIYQERERREGTIRGLFTNQGLGFRARETSRRGWKLGIAAMVVSAVGAGLAVAAIVPVWRTRHRVPRVPLLAVTAHFMIGGGLLAYWIVTGIPQPWVD